MKFVGLTNNPDELKRIHGNPEDWWERVFSNEYEARKWMRVLVKNYGYKIAGMGYGWKYGFTYTPQQQYKVA